MDPIEELPGASDKGKALLVLVASGGFADQHDAALRRPIGENRVLSGALQLAAVEIGERSLKFCECRARGCQSPRRTRRGGKGNGFGTEGFFPNVPRLEGRRALARLGEWRGYSTLPLREGRSAPSRFGEG